MFSPNVLLVAVGALLMGCVDDPEARRACDCPVNCGKSADRCTVVCSRASKTRAVAAARS